MRTQTTLRSRWFLAFWLVAALLLPLSAQAHTAAIHHTDRVPAHALQSTVRHHHGHHVRHVHHATHRVEQKQAVRWLHDHRAGKR